MKTKPCFISYNVKDKHVYDLVLQYFFSACNRLAWLLLYYIISGRATQDMWIVDSLKSLMNGNLSQMRVSGLSEFCLL